MLLMLPLGATSVASAANQFRVEPVNIEPGETMPLEFVLDNDEPFYGFQADIALPEGLTFVKGADELPQVQLSDRCDASFSLVRNLLDDRNLRLGAFSTTHAAISGTEGTLLTLSVSASADFTGGELSISRISFITEDDADVELPDFELNIGTEHVNRLYIEDFTIAVGETKEVAVILDNETPFVAFQTDVYLPEGLEYVEGSAAMTSRGASGHSLSVKAFDGGRVRMVCFCSNSTPFAGKSGALLTFEVTATNAIAEMSEIELRNSLFSMADAREVPVGDSSCEVTAERIFVESIELTPAAAEILRAETVQIYATVLPVNASNRELLWERLDEEVATVSATGLVTALKAGEVEIRATATDGSEVSAICLVTVKSDGGESDSLAEIEGFGVSIAGPEITVSGPSAAKFRLFTVDGVEISPLSSDCFRVPCCGVYLLQGPGTVRKIKI